MTVATARPALRTVLAPAEGAVPAGAAATPLSSLLPDLLLSPPVAPPSPPMLPAWALSPPVEGVVVVPPAEGVPLPFEVPGLEPAGLVPPVLGLLLLGGSAGQLGPDERWLVPISKQCFSRHHEVRSA